MAIKGARNNGNSGYPRSTARRPDSKSELLGQVETPSDIARKMAKMLSSSKAKGPIHILDPCIGRGAFPKALIETNNIAEADSFVMVELDEDCLPAIKKLKPLLGPNTVVINGDYLEKRFDSQFDYVIMNPPYIRQEWLDKKSDYQILFKERYGLAVPGTSNCYVYFVIKAMMDLKPGGRCVCIVYDSWQSTKYGEWLSRVLSKLCRSVEVIPVEGEVFKGRLIGTTIIILDKREDVNLGLIAEFDDRKVSESVDAFCDKFATIDDLCVTRRGLRLKQAKFFLCEASECDKTGATPFMKKSTLFKGYRVPEDHPEAALLTSSTNVDSRLKLELKRRLRLAISKPKEYASILNWHKEYPDTWFEHSKAPHAPIIFNYYIRNRPRHILNPVHAYSDNFYGLSPRDNVDPMCVLAVLNSTYVCISILECSRNQGNGLAKIQLYEYRQVKIPDWRKFDSYVCEQLIDLGHQLVETNEPKIWEQTLRNIDMVLSLCLGEGTLEFESLERGLEEVKSKACLPRC